MVLLNTCLPDMKKKKALNCFNLHYLVTFKFAHSFMCYGHRDVFTGPSPLRTLFCWRFTFFLMKFLKLFLCGLSCMVPILLS